jgi:hypothetical protein
MARSCAVYTRVIRILKGKYFRFRASRFIEQNVEGFADGNTDRKLYIYINLVPRAFSCLASSSYESPGNEVVYIYIFYIKRYIFMY